MLSNASHTTRSADETIALGRQIAAELPKKAVVLLIGNLGAGKTTLTQGIIEGLGVATRDEVASMMPLVKSSPIGFLASR